MFLVPDGAEDPLLLVQHPADLVHVAPHGLAVAGQRVHLAGVAQALLGRDVQMEDGQLTTDVVHVLVEDLEAETEKNNSNIVPRCSDLSKRRNATETQTEKKAGETFSEEVCM